MNLLTEGPTNVITGQRLKSSLSEPQGHFEPNFAQSMFRGGRMVWPFSKIKPNFLKSSSEPMGYRNSSFD